MLSSMTPVIVEKEGKLFLDAGSPGGSTIPKTVIQVLINAIDYNMGVSAAVDTTGFHHQWLPDLIRFEPECFDSLTVSKLKLMGHELRSGAAIGKINAIRNLPDGRIEGTPDRRGVNSAIG
jgi:gamma-glutamyltranspeptidase/glutathione hydrolase